MERIQTLFFAVLGYKWVHSSAYASIPTDAVVGGNDYDGDMMYVGRSNHNGDLLPAKVIPNKRIAFVSWGGEEIPKEYFEVLCGTDLCWQHCYDHVIPDTAILCGETSLGQAVYIGRGHYEGSLTIGKVSSVHKSLFIPFRGGERRLETYEILVEEKPKTGWTVSAPSSPLPPPPPALLKPVPENTFPPPYGEVAEKPFTVSISKPPTYAPPMPMPTATPMPMPMPTPMPTATPMPMPMPTPMPTPMPMPTPAEVYDPQKATPLPYPTNFPCEPPPSYASTFTPMPMPSPSPNPYQPAQISPMRPQQPYQSDVWMTASASHIPQNHVHAGHDVDGLPLIVARAFHQGDMIPGKVNPAHRCAYISYRGQEFTKTNFEILMRYEGYHWTPASEGFVPPGAVSGGRTVNGETLYVGRGYINGTLTPGKVQRSHGCLYTPFGGAEVRLSNYEVLVRRS